MSSQNISPPPTLSPAEAQLARESARLLGTVSLAEGEPVSLVLAGVDAQIPATAARVLLTALTAMGRGQAVTTVTLDAELSTQQAADLLGVSRPFVVKLIDQGELPARKVGAYRRLHAADVLVYRRRSEAARGAALDELTRQAQELGMGY